MPDATISLVMGINFKKPEAMDENNPHFIFGETVFCPVTEELIRSFKINVPMIQNGIRQGHGVFAVLHHHPTASYGITLHI